MSVGDFLYRGQDSPDEASSRPPRVAVFDQFEELFVYYPDRWQDRAGFFDEVREALDSDRLLRVVFVLREDYLAHMDRYAPMFPEKLRTRFRLDGLDRDAALQAISDPLRDTGRRFAEGVAGELVDKMRKTRVSTATGESVEILGEFVEPFHLQVMCRRLWEQLTPEVREIGPTHVAAVGDVERVLADYYRESAVAVAREASDAGRGIGERAIREWFNALFDDAGRRERVLQGPLNNQGVADDHVAIALEGTYLVQREGNRYELSHDRLVEPIRQDNAAWFEENLSMLQLQAQLWDKGGRQSGQLLYGEILAKAEFWAEEHADEVTPIERAFLNACGEARRTAQRERRDRRLIFAWAIAATALFAVAAFFFFQARTQERLATAQSRFATARERAAAVLHNLSVDPERSLLLAIHATRYMDDQDANLSAHVVDALHRAIQTSRVKQTFRGHSNWVNRVAFDSMGSRLATASADTTVKVWDVGGVGVRTLSGRDGHFGSVTSVSFSPDDQLLVTGSLEGTAKIWEVATGEVLNTIAVSDVPVQSVTFNVDGSQVITASADGTAQVWDVQSITGRGRLVHSPGIPVTSAAISRDGTRLVTAGEDKTARIWDTASLREGVRLIGHTAPLTEAVFSPDGHWLATGSTDRTARIWDTATGRELRRLSGHTDTVFSVAFSPDGTLLATASEDGTAKVWDPVSGTELTTLYGHTSAVHSVAFSPDGSKMATGAWDDTARLWSVVSHTAIVKSIAFSPDGTQLATGSADATAKVWSVATGTERQGFRLRDEVASVVFSPSGERLATADRDGTTRIWDLQSGDLVASAARGSEVMALSFSPDGRQLAVGYWVGPVVLLDSESGAERARFGDDGLQVFSVAFNSDGTQLAAAIGQDGTVRVWDIGSRQEIFRLADRPYEVKAAIFNPREPDIAVAVGSIVRRMRGIPSPTELRPLSGHDGAINGIAFSPNGRYLASASADKAVKVWDWATGEVILTLSGHTAPVQAVAFSPDGRRIATASSDRTWHIYPLDVQELKETAMARVTRDLTEQECEVYLHTRPCPALPTVR
jgi:WD40 repeat protein